jgi:ketopantoate reductase
MANTKPRSTKVGVECRRERLTTYDIHNLAVLKSPAEATQAYDYIVCAHKAVNPASVPPVLKPAVGDNTTFVIMQNGVGNEEPFATFYPRQTILSAVVWTGGTQTSPGIIKHTKSENVELGIFRNPAVPATVEKERLDLFTQLLQSGGTPFQVYDDIQIKRWVSDQKRIRSARQAH